MEFKKKLSSRWVLCGEHSVLRGGKALVYPLPHYTMDLRYIDFPKKDFEMEVEDSIHYEKTKEILKALLIKALNLLDKKAGDLSGRFFVKNFIPFGAGLGGSAALSVALAWLLNKVGYLNSKDMGDFAVSLEDTFHGKSSGMDVYAILENRPLLYQKGCPFVFLPSPETEIQPFLFLSDSGACKSTKQALSQVKRLFEEQPQAAKALDKQMQEAVECALQSLGLKEEKAIREKLRQSFDMAEDCFQKWGLIPPGLATHIKQLKASGALAAKPTGAGMGGFVVSLWDQKSVDVLNPRLLI